MNRAAALAAALAGAAVSPAFAAVPEPRAVIDCRGTVESLRLSHPHLRCTCRSAHSSPDCSSGSGTSAPAPRSGTKRSSKPSVAVEALKGALQDMQMQGQRASQTIGQKAVERAGNVRAVDALQRGQVREAETFRQAVERKRRAEEDARRRGLGSELLAPPPARAPAGGRTPMLLRGDPADECRGKPASLACPDLNAHRVPPLSDSPETRASEAAGLRLLESLDAGAAPETVAAMREKVEAHALSEAASAAAEKTKDYFSEKSEAVAQHLSVLERVKEQGSIVKDYAMNTLEAVQDKASNAACALGTGRLACLDAFHAAGARQRDDLEELNSRSQDYMAAQFYASSPEETVRETAASSAFERFFSAP